MRPKDEQLCKAVTIIINMYINTLEIIIKHPGNTQGTLPYITWGPVQDIKTEGDAKTEGDLYIITFIEPLAYLFYDN